VSSYPEGLSRFSGPYDGSDGYRKTLPISVFFVRLRWSRCPCACVATNVGLLRSLWVSSIGPIRLGAPHVWSYVSAALHHDPSGVEQKFLSIRIDIQHFMQFVIGSATEGSVRPDTGAAAWGISKCRYRQCCIKSPSKNEPQETPKQYSLLLCFRFLRSSRCARLGRNDLRLLRNSQSLKVIPRVYKLGFAL
jgi:hypothetical protein